MGGLGDYGTRRLGDLETCGLGDLRALNFRQAQSLRVFVSCLR